MNTQLNTLHDGTIEVVCSEDGFTAKGYVSSHHLVDPKINQLKQNLAKQAERAYEQPCQQLKPMHDEPEYQVTFHLTSGKILILSRAIKRALDRWPGGDPDEQLYLQDLNRCLTAAALDIQLDRS